MLRKDAKIELIRRVPLFQQCSKRELAEVAAAADELDVPTGTTLARAGEVGREFVVIADGAAEVTRGDEKINELGGGDFFGEIALISGRPRSATVTATADTHLLVLTDRAFRRLLEQSPPMHLKVLQALADRLIADSV